MIALLRVLDLAAEQGGWPDARVMPFCGFERPQALPQWYSLFASKMRSADRPGLQLLPTHAPPTSASPSENLARGRAALECLDYPAAERALKAAYYAAPDDADAAFMYGASIFLGYGTSEAIPPLECALRDSPSHRGARLYLARAYELAGEWQKAQPLYRSVAEGRGALGPYRRYALARLAAP